TGPKPATSAKGRTDWDPYTIAGVAVALIAVLVAGFVGYLYVVSDVQQARNQSILADELSDSLYRDVAPLGGTIAKGTPVAQLRIPAIGLRQVVVEGTTADSLAKGPGHLRTSGLPGQGGHSVIMGRAHTFGGPFGDIGDLKVGQRIETVTQQGEFTYKVVERKHVKNGHDDVLAPGPENRLVLITADSWIRPGGRTVVIADLQGAPRPQEGRRPQGLHADEKGTGGYTGFGIRLLLWAQALVLVAGVLVWALRRYDDRRVTLLLGTPIVLAVVWALYESAALILPATL
ncbi:class D sortase, partial [Streptomyces sp. SID3343]|uniref:class D sortase n=1 Tax=Streptomyces sp. SID3343 TaxID=2690260 RepID=UPI0013705B51